MAELIISNEGGYKKIVRVMKCKYLKWHISFLYLIQSNEKRHTNKRENIVSHS